MNTTNNELMNYITRIREELEAIYNGTTNEVNGDGEPETFYDYFEDPLDYEYTISSRGDYLGVKIFVTLGGPNVWVDTRRGEIAGAWGADRADIWLPSEIAAEIDSIFEEYYNCTRC